MKNTISFLILLTASSGVCQTTILRNSATTNHSPFVLADSSSNLLSTAVPLGGGIFLGGGDGDWKADLFASEENIIGNGFISGGGSFSGGQFNGSIGSFVSSDDGGFAGGSFIGTANCYVAADAGCFAGGFFDGSSNVIVSTHDGGHAGGIFISATNCSLSSDAGIIQANLNDAQSVTLSQTGNGFLGLSAPSSSNITVVASGLIYAALNSCHDVQIGGGTSMLIIPPINNYTNTTISGEVGILAPSGNLYGLNTNGFHGLGSGLTNLVSLTLTNKPGVLTSGLPYTVPTTGFIILSLETTNGNNVTFSNVTFGRGYKFGSVTALGTNFYSPIFPVRRGDVVCVTNGQAGGANINFISSEFDSLQ